MTNPTLLLPFQPDTMSPAHLAAVSDLARYSGSTHHLYTYQLRRWFGWCRTNGLDPLVHHGTRPRVSSGSSSMVASATVHTRR